MATVIRLADYAAPSFSSPEAGEKMGHDLVAAMQRGAVTLDFSGVRTVLSVGLNPAIAQVYQAFDRPTIGRRLDPVNMTSAHAFVWKHVLETARRHLEDLEALRRSTAVILSD